MKKGRRIISLLICMAMLFCLMPTGVFAAEGDVTVDGIIYSLNGDGTAYSVKGGEDTTVTEAVIKSEVNGLPCYINRLWSVLGLAKSCKRHDTQ